jgi:hypothetical protein
MSSTKTRVLAATALAIGSVVVVAVASAAGVETQTADVRGQGPGGPVVSEDGATLQRSDNGISVKLTMPTPEPGSYIYPPANPFLPAAVPGHPEAYSLWAFVFNYPNLCTGGACDMDDIGAATAARGGVYNAAGHIEGGPTLTLSGHVSVGSTQFSGSPLLEPRTAFVHLAVAPHGAVNPALLPDQITKPIGSLPLWWIAALE